MRILWLPSNAAGAGKTRLATSIADRTGLPVVHLDLLFWRAGWVSAAREEALHELATVITRDRWILDGNFLSENVQDDRFARADAVIFLDVSRPRCIWRVLSRLVWDLETSRADLPEGCREGFDLQLRRWIWRYPRADRPRVLEVLRRLDRERVTAYHLRSGAEVQRFLDGL
jgi:adenylate kinase family enzyme